MSAQPDNVRPLHPTRAAQALAEARAMRPGELDRTLKMEAAKTPDPAAIHWQELLDRGDAIALTDAAFPEGIVRGLLARLETATRERDQARAVAVTLEQLAGEALHVVEPFLRQQNVAGGLARNVQSALDPQPEPSPAA